MKKSNHNVLIADLLLTSASALTLSDRRLYNYLLYNAFDALEKKLNFVIHLNDLTGVYGTGLPPIPRLKESIQRLMRTLIEYKTSSGNWMISSILEHAELDEKEEQLFYSYPIQCRHLFTDPFTLEKCLIQAHFIQKYSNLLYEILASSHYANQSTLAIEIADIRSRLHIADSKLSNFSDFDRFVLLPAVKEINSYASFAVKYHTQRKGMKVTHVIFEMQNKRNISGMSAKQVIPAKRPRLFIDNPEKEMVYAYLLNAETPERRKFFDLACKLAAKKKQIIDEEAFDRPDLWFQWVEDQVFKKQK